jgi:hypothetical protein
MKATVVFEVSVLVTVEGAWGQDCQLAQLKMQAEREARGRLTRLGQENPDVAIRTDAMKLKTVALEG